MPFYKRKPDSTAALTFKERVRLFWKWYKSQSHHFFDVIEAGRCADLANEVSAGVEMFLPGFAWEFGPGAGGQGHSFTLSGEGDSHRQLLALHWHSQAPTLDGWTFYPARQPADIESHTIQINGQTIAPIEFWLTPSVNQEVENVDITVWHPLYDRIPENDRFLRGDIVFGSTTHLRLIEDFASAEGELDDTLEGTGADFVFVAFDRAILPKGAEATTRGGAVLREAKALTGPRSYREGCGAIGTAGIRQAERR